MRFEIAVTYLNYTIEMHGNYTEFIVSFNIQVTIIIERVVTNGQKCMQGLGYEQCTTIIIMLFKYHLKFDRISGARVRIISNGLKTL